MKLIIEQIAICPPNPAAAFQLLKDMGLAEWSNDTVVAKGFVFGDAAENTARLAFNYDALSSAKEFEVLHYVTGDNWMQNHERGPSVSHFGMHVTAEELEQWKAFFVARNIRIAQEVFTQSHTNPVIAGKRSYQYVIFDTRGILGVDLKFIRRINNDREAA